MAKIGTGPKLNAEGKKDWAGYYKGMSNKVLVEHAAATLLNCPMAYLKLLGKELGRVAKITK